MNTVEFWKKASLSHVENLIKSYDKYVAEASDSFKDMYADDQADFKKAVKCFREADDVALSKLVDYMDTSPREELIVAFAEDLGKQWVELTLGYEVTGGI